MRASEWQLLSLKAAGVSLIDCEHKTPPNAGEGYPYVAIPQLRDGRLELSDVRRITREDYLAWTRRATPQGDDVILSRRCNPGETAYVPWGLECAIGQNLVLLRADGTKIFPPFLRWLVRGPDWWEQIQKFINVGAVFDSLKCADIPRFELRIPPLPEQRRIASLLGGLDTKIELNRRINETLEAMARAIFKSWFVDFDPVKAKAEGRQPAGMNAETAALFPNRFIDSELGPIPEGWRLANLAAISGAIRESVDPDKVPDDTPYIGLEHMPQKSIALGTWGMAGQVQSQKTKFKDGQILFGKLRPYFHKVGIAPVAGICSTDIVVLEPMEGFFWFCLGHVSSEVFIAYTTARSDGTRMPRTSWGQMGEYPLVIPSSNVARAFDSFCRPLGARLRGNLFESRTLAELRDALLPKLISGELRIPDAEAVAEEAVA